MDKDNLLEVTNLKTYFYTDDGVVKAVNGIDFKIKKGETLGMVGESGSGKSISSLSIIRLIPIPPGKIVDGKILFKGKDLLRYNIDEIRKVRGNDISMIFQEPMTSLNPVLTIGNQILETIVLHQKVAKDRAKKKAIEMLNLVGIPNPEKRFYEYSHELSGGQRQRVMIAMALSCNPDLLIADEPTTALDVTIQAQILELIKKLQDEIGMAVLMITHDLGVIAEIADNVVVVYAGKAMEYSNVLNIFQNPKHPYTKSLMKSIPKLTDKANKKLEVIEGSIPDPLFLPSGCKFHPRCKYTNDICMKEEPKLEKIDDNHYVRCWMYNKEKEGYFNKSL
jgi:peptide/nickel transport system ATP-binding protein/oligopeptide transport system ATP-binding protein